MTLATDFETGHTKSHVWGWFWKRLSTVTVGFPAHGLLYAVGLATYCAGLLMNHRLGDQVNLELGAIFSGSALLGMMLIAFTWLLIDLTRLWNAGYAGSPLVALFRTLLVDILSPGRTANGFHALLCTGLFAVGFTNIKSDIPRIDPFTWDKSLMDVDRVLHFGVLPHDLLMPLFGSPLVIFLLNLAYNLWFVVMIGFLIWQGCQERDTAQRQRFLLAYMLCWGLGTGILGLIFSSAGPCFYDRLVAGPNPYSDLMGHLERVATQYPVFALDTQDMLWQSYLDSRGTVSGISAMPSMHVATSCLFVLCARASGLRWLSWICAAFLVVIFIGSVMLGWHYAVDGYVGILIAVFVWWLAGRIADVQFSRTSPPVSSRPS